MGYNYQPAEITDFSKGMVDDYVNGPITAAETLLNFKILNNSSLKTRPGTLLDSEVDAQVPIGTQRIQTLISYDIDDKLFVHTGKKIFYRDPISYASLLGPTGNNPFNAADLNTYLAYAEWNKLLFLTSSSFDKPVRIYKDDAGLYQLRTAGLPALASAPTPSGAAGVNAYIYAYYYIYVYKAGDQTFEDFGPVTQVQVENVEAPNVSPITTSSIPVLANGAGDNYDVIAIKIGISRTISGGVEFYKAGEVTNGTTMFVDTVSDDAIQANQSLYINGNVPDNDPPPLAKFCHSVNGFTYYAHLKVGTEVYPNRYRQSQGLDPDSVPASYEDEIEDEITGFSSVNDVPIIGCRKHVYRVEGTFDEVGRGGMAHKRISDTAGCVSHESFVQAESLLFWWGNDGIYFTDGFKVQKCTTHLNKRYQNFLATLAGKTQKIKAAYNPLNKLIHWTVSTTAKSAGAEECDSIWVMDLQFGVSEAIASFLWNGYSTFAPSSLCFHNNILHRGDALGYVLKFDDTIFTDPQIIPGEPPADWFEETIIWKYRSVASNFGTSFVRKIANKILISAKNETNVSIAIIAINDDGKLVRNLSPIRWRKNFIWGDEEFVWGDPNFVWFYGGTIELDRRFPTPGMRFNYIQIEITNAYLNIVNSDLYGQVTVDPVLKTLTLVDAIDGDWPTQAVDYDIYLEHDNYERAYKVTGRTNDTLTVEDIGGTLQAGNYRWQLKGFRKNEVLNLVGYSISWAPVTRSHDTGNLGETGGLS